MRVDSHSRYNYNASIPHKNVGRNMVYWPWHGGGLRPGVGRRIVNVYFVLRLSTLVALMLTADGIKLSVQRHPAHVIARIRHRRQHLFSVWCGGSPSRATVEIESPMCPVVRPHSITPDSAAKIVQFAS